MSNSRDIAINEYGRYDNMVPALEKLMKADKLRELNFYRSYPNAREMLAITDALKENQNLEKLYLGNNSIEAYRFCYSRVY